MGHMKTFGLIVLGLVLLIGLLPVVSITASSSTPIQAPADSDGVSQAENSPFDFVAIAPTLREPTPEPVAFSKVGIVPTPIHSVLSNAPAPPLN
jgi:hypothetical protein